jgi:CheY-like chemotaxis protein
MVGRDLTSYIESLRPDGVQQQPVESMSGSQAPQKKEKLLIQVLRKIPIFKGLSLSQVKRILALCSHRACKPGDMICQSDTASDEMYVLLSGEAAVVTPDGLKVATILPVTTVGEMGVITGQPRSATVEVTKPSAIFTIQKSQFDTALKEEADIQAKVYRAIIDVLAGKLNNDSVRLRDHHMERDRSDGRIALLERRLVEQEQRATIAIDMVAESSGREVDELVLHIADEVKHLTPRVLVVDDESDFRALVKNALPTLEVLEAESGEQAIEVVQEEELDLVITDINMPGMSGIELLTYLRAQHPDLKVIAVSGFMDAGEVEANFDFDGFAEKPFSLEQFQDLVSKHVARVA